MRIMYSCCRAHSAPVPLHCVPLCVCVCVCIHVPESTSAPLHALCLLNVTQAASPPKPVSLPKCALHFKEQSDVISPPVFSVISSECSAPPFCVCSFKNDSSESSSDQIELVLDNWLILVIFNSGEQTTLS